MEELLKQLIEGQKQITAWLDSMENGQQQITTRLDRMESSMATKQDLAETKTELKASIYGVETQLLETRPIIRNIEQNTAATAAQVDALTVSTAKIEGKQERISGDVGYLVRKAIDHDDDIRELRRAK